MANIGGTNASGEVLTGTTGDDVIFNGPFDNRISDGGDDIVDGLGGFNTAVMVYTGHAAPITLDNSNPNSTNAVSTGGSLTNIQSLHFYGGSGNDLVTAGNVEDWLYGGAGNDTLIANGGNDMLSGGTGTNTLNGGAGFDTVTYEFASAGVAANLLAGTGTGEGSDTFISIENLLGSQYNDVLTGDAGDNQLIDRRFGNDTLSGGDGADLIKVERDYSLSSNASFVTLNGDAGNDVLEFNGDPAGRGTAAAGARFFDQAAINGGGGDDQITVRALGYGVIDAGDGNDTVSMDVMSVAGGYRNVALGAGADTLNLLAATDTSLSVASVTLYDFKAGGAVDADHLNLNAFLNSYLTGGYVANADPFATNHLRLQQSGADTVLLLDRDGGGDNFSTFITFKNLAPSQLTTANLGGFSGATPAGGTQNGTPAADTLTGGINADTLNGADGNDRLIGGLGGDFLNGGAGYDTAVYASVRRTYTANLSGGGGTITGGTDGGDTLTSVERLQFIDGYISTDATAGNTAASVYRLYQTMLNRVPDSAGLASWVQAIDFKGSTLKTVANGFIGSPEFNGTYGALSNDAFVELMYSNVLHRGSDASGKATWVGLLNSGGGTRADVAIGFSESNENVGNLSSAIQKGVWVGDLNAGIAARFYDTVFGRLPDAGGLDTWTKALNSGASLSTVANGFVASNEFKTTYGNLNNDGFVELMYQNVLHRASDASGKATWVNALNAGSTRADVVVGFSESAEHIRLTAPHIDDGVWIA